MVDPTELAAEPDSRLRLSDGLYGGLIAGAVNSVFFAVADLVVHESLASPYVFLATAALGTNARNLGWPSLVMGLAMMFLGSALGGIVYAFWARRIPMLAETPVSGIAGLLYGLVIWLLFVDLVVPTTGLQQTIDRPLWVSAVGLSLFWGTALCEYLANVARSRKKKLAS
jgi:hypothetical protein